MNSSTKRETELHEDITFAALDAGEMEIRKDGPTTETWPEAADIKAILKKAYGLSGLTIPYGKWEELQSEKIWHLLSGDIGAELKAALLELIREGNASHAWGKPQSKKKQTNQALWRGLLKRWVAGTARRAYLRAWKSGLSIGNRWKLRMLVLNPVDSFTMANLKTQTPELRLLMKTEHTWKLFHQETGAQGPKCLGRKESNEAPTLFEQEKAAEERELAHYPNFKKDETKGRPVPQEEEEAQREIVLKLLQQEKKAQEVRLPPQEDMASAERVLDGIDECCRILSNTERWEEKSPTNWPEKSDTDSVIAFIVDTWESTETECETQKHLEETLHKVCPEVVYRATEEDEKTHPWLATNGRGWINRVAGRTTTAKGSLETAVRAAMIKQALSVMPLSAKKNKVVMETLKNTADWLTIAGGELIKETIPGRGSIYLSAWECLRLADPSGQEPRPRILRPTAPQRKALQKLNQHYQIWKRRGQTGGFSLRPPLLIGSSGTGKNTILRALCSMHNIPCLILNAPNWQVMSAASRQFTLADVATFLGQHEQCVIAIDEIDKVGNGKDGDAGGWYRGVRGEIMGFIEKEIDGYCPRRWTAEIKARFREGCFIVAAGTWQKVFRPTWETGGDNKIIQGGLGDGAPDFEELLGANLTTEELLARTANPIFLQPPGPAEFLDLLERIHEGRPQLTKKEKERLAEEAVASGKNMRWAEDYAEKLLLGEAQKVEIPEAIGIKENPPPDEPVGNPEEE
jgi:hypothetical protein